MLAHCGELVAAVEVPVSADLENCFADDPEGVAATITAAMATGLAGGSVEDFTGDTANPIYELAQATERVQAAAEAAHTGPAPFVLTARAENYLHGRADLADTIARLQAYQEAGADVLFAPRVVEPSDLGSCWPRSTVRVSVLVTPDAPDGRRAGRLGVSRISVGGAVAAAAYGFAIHAVTARASTDRGATAATADMLAASSAASRCAAACHSADGDRHLDLDGPVAGQSGHADGRARVPARLPEHVGQHPAGTVHHGRLLVEVGCRGDVTGHREHALDAVERPQRLLQHGQGVQRADGGRLGTLLDGDGIAQAAEARQLAGDTWQLTRGARHAVVHDHRVERVVRRCGPCSVKPNSASRARMAPSLTGRYRM